MDEVNGECRLVPEHLHFLNENEVNANMKNVNNERGEYESVFPDDFLKNLYKRCRKNPYRLKKFRTFFRHEYQIKGFCKYY